MIDSLRYLRSLRLDRYNFLRFLSLVIFSPFHTYTSRNVVLYCQLNVISSLISFQLLDFRQVLARLLGLDINTLSVPDYEIISRLERLVQAHHAHSITTHSLEASLQDMESGFRAGYDDAVAILRTPSPVKAS